MDAEKEKQWKLICGRCWGKKKRLMLGGNIDRRNTRWQRREAEMAAETKGGGWGGELPAADGSQSQWGMEGDPAVTLKQQVEAIISSGMADCMSAHTLISWRAQRTARERTYVLFLRRAEAPRQTFELFPASPPSHLASHRVPFVLQASAVQECVSCCSPFPSSWFSPLITFSDTQQNCSPLAYSCFRASQG